MGSKQNKAKRKPLTFNQIGVTREELERMYRNRVKELKCPHCELEFTDFAVDWGDVEGRKELIADGYENWRDGPSKVKCEMCGNRSWIAPFTFVVRSAEP